MDLVVGLGELRVEFAAGAEVGQDDFGGVRDHVAVAAFGLAVAVDPREEEVGGGYDEQAGFANGLDDARGPEFGIWFVEDEDGGDAASEELRECFLLNFLEIAAEDAVGGRVEGLDPFCDLLLGIGGGVAR